MGDTSDSISGLQAVKEQLGLISQVPAAKPLVKDVESVGRGRSGKQNEKTKTITYASEITIPRVTNMSEEHI